ncbi:MAG: DUF3501 family protein [Thiothrix sp.]|nr:DUF3501 family protein [Thiothrix sp.]HPE61630.1 DUF3501 family protein [Thiolinea sp.]
MKKLTRTDLMSLEQYAEKRAAFRAEVIAHKKNRQIPLGPNATLYFEDRLTVQYQIQEMLRIERIFEVAGIEEELEAYNPLIPEGSNWKATFMIEFPDPEERKDWLTRLRGVDRKVWVQVGDFGRVSPITNEDLERETEDKTAAVHFMRFELTADMVTAARDGAAILMGIDHPEYRYSLNLSAAQCQALVADLG